jgi:hypothetical protein
MRRVKENGGPVGLLALGTFLVTLLGIASLVASERIGSLEMTTGIACLIVAVGGLCWLGYRMYWNRRGRPIIAQHNQAVENQRSWQQILGYLHAVPRGIRSPEDVAALTAVHAAGRMTSTAAWNSGLLDTYDARIDLRMELHAVLDAARDIAAVRRTVGQRDERYAEQWQIDTDALNRLAAQVQRRVDVLLQYEGTINRVQRTLDDAAARDHRRAAAFAVDDLVRRRGGDDLATDIAASRAAEADAAEGAIQMHLQAAHALKDAFARPFTIIR